MIDSIISESLVLLVGNGRSSERISGPAIDRALRDFDGCRLVVAGCNMRGLGISANIIGAIDPRECSALIRGCAYHSHLLLIPETQIVPKEVAASKLLRRFLPRQIDGGTGLALFRWLLAARPLGIVLVGFDGAADPRSLSTGTNVADGPLSEWRESMAREYSGAIKDASAVPVATIGDNQVASISAMSRSAFSEEINQAMSIAASKLESLLLKNGSAVACR